MKTTLNLDDELFRDAKKRAAEDGTTLTYFVEEALRNALADEPPEEPYVFTFPTISGGPFLVDIADRDALYDLMEGRG
jgi:plasmid stability protein